MVERHLNYWKGRQSIVTVNALFKAQSVLTALLDALYSEEGRLEKVVYTLCKHRLKDLLIAVRSPTVRNRQPSDEEKELLAVYLLDKSNLKTSLITVVKQLETMLEPQFDQVAFSTILAQPKENIQQFLRVTTLELEEVPVVDEEEEATEIVVLPVALQVQDGSSQAMQN